MLHKILILIALQAMSVSAGELSRCVAGELAPNSKDTYLSFEDLASHQKEGRDFRISVINRSSPVTVLAIHGGKIERGTSEFARAVAGPDYNIYLFEGLNEDSSAHITSQHFDEPRALAITRGSRFDVSIHGFYEKKLLQIKLGGANSQMKKLFATQMSQSGLPIQIDLGGGKFPGKDPTNIVNRAKQSGLQLELSTALRNKMKEDPALQDKLASVVRATIALTLSKQ